MDLEEDSDDYSKVQIPETYRNCPTTGWVAKEFIQRASNVTAKVFSEYAATSAASTTPQLTATISTRNVEEGSLRAQSLSFINYVYDAAGVMFSKRRSYNQSCRHNGTKVASTSFGYCYRWVKCQLKNTGETNRYLPGASAKNAGGELRRIGLRNIINSIPNKCANNAPDGAVLVYSGGAHGHIETKAKGHYVSDYRSQRARTGSSCSRSGRGRTLTGVYVK